MREIGFSSMKWVLRHQHELSKRHRDFLSLVLIYSAEDSKNLRKRIKNEVRASDTVFDLGDGVCILMPCTDSEGANCAIERFRGLCIGLGELRCGRSTFPEEGQTSDSLLSNAMKNAEIQEGARFDISG